MEFKVGAGKSDFADLRNSRDSAMRWNQTKKKGLEDRIFY